MTWNPSSARDALQRSALTTFIDERKKICSFRLENGREIALLEENSKKVSVYVWPEPIGLPGVKVEKCYAPTATRKGRHSNLELITSTLGFSSRACRVTLVDIHALQALLDWYRTI